MILHKTFEFDAGHRLIHHSGKCHNYHGHRYRVEVWIEGEPDETSGMVEDFTAIKDVVFERYDHNFVFNKDDPAIELVKKNQAKPPILLNGDPTVESIVKDMVGLLQEAFRRGRVKRLRVWETASSYAEWEAP
ncbi:MAG: 6-pyruvoyl trahydropterin synthase family protein [bacterium]